MTDSYDKLKKKSSSHGFQTLGLSKPIFSGIMRLGYKVPTPIQRKVLPIALSGRDVVAMARTGSGKTAAFLIPVLEKLKAHSTVVGARAVILSPTRELAYQTYKFAQALSRFTDIRLAVIIGGDSMEQQFDILSQNPDIIIATPGRLVHHLLEIPDFSLKSVKYLVFDEADRLFEMGFSEQITKIMNEVNPSKQCYLFSATLPTMLLEFTKADLKNPEVIRLDSETKISETLNLVFAKEEKESALLFLIDSIIPKKEQVIVFCATRYGVEYLLISFLYLYIFSILFSLICFLFYYLLNTLEYSVTGIYGTMDMTARKINLGKFRNGKSRILIVTDVAARGLDIPYLDNVINYDFPPKCKIFVHRVGRCGRQERKGTAYSIVTNSELSYIADLGLYLQRDYFNTPDLSLKVNELTHETAWVGLLPRSLLLDEIDRVNYIKKMKAEDVDPMINALENSYKMYNKSREEPSTASINKIKEIGELKIHPLFVDLVSDDDKKLEEVKQKLSNYRPVETVMEVEHIKSNRSKDEIMKKKRKIHESIIVENKKQKKIKSEEESKKEEIEAEDEEEEKEIIEKDKELIQSLSHLGDDNDDEYNDDYNQKQKVHFNISEKKKIKKLMKNGKTEEEAKEIIMEERMKKGNDENNKNKSNKDNNFKDEYYYMPNKNDPSTKHADNSIAKAREELGINIEDYSMDLVPDEDGEIDKKKQVTRWDPKKKKYVKGTVAELDKRLNRVKTDSGKIIKLKDNEKGELYKKWARRSKKKIGFEDTTEGKIDYRRGRKIKHSIMNDDKKKQQQFGKYKSELKDENQIRKELKQEEKNKIKQMNRKDRQKYFEKKGKGLFNKSTNNNYQKLKGAKNQKKKHH